jgi:hypothetical protein
MPRSWLLVLACCSCFCQGQETIPEHCDGSQEYVKWIDTVFGDCVYSSKDLASFWLGILSICAWLVCTLPQVLRFLTFRLSRTSDEEVPRP